MFGLAVRQKTKRRALRGYTEVRGSWLGHARALLLFMDECTPLVATAFLVVTLKLDACRRRHATGVSAPHLSQQLCYIVGVVIERGLGWHRTRCFLRFAGPGFERGIALWRRRGTALLTHSGSFRTNPLGTKGMHQNVSWVQKVPRVQATLGIVSHCKRDHDKIPIASTNASRSQKMGDKGTSNHETAHAPARAMLSNSECFFCLVFSCVVVGFCVHKAAGFAEITGP